jgi:transcription initiation factor TFIID subunit 15
VSSFRPPRRSGLRAPWVAGVLAVLVAAALAGAGAAAGAQEAPDTTATQQAPDDSGGTASSVDGSQSTESTAPADDATTTTEAAADTTTTAADNGAQDPAADENGNINNLPLNSGIQTGTVFNPVPYGEIPGNTPQVLIQRPGSGRIVPLNREITIRARFKNFTPGFFSDPKSEYGLGTQRLDGSGNLKGHNHGCFQRVARDGSVPADTCDSFVVLSQDGTSDVLTGIMPPLTQPGRYRLCVDAAAENHYPAARAFAQRGGPVDCVRVLAMDFNQLRGAQPAANANQ